MSRVSCCHGQLVEMLVVALVISAEATRLAMAERFPNGSDSTLRIVEQDRTPDRR